MDQNNQAFEQPPVEQEIYRQSPFEYDQTTTAGQTIFYHGDVTTVGKIVSSTITVDLRP